MFVKTRIRLYDQNQKADIEKFMLDQELAQNVTHEQHLIAGDFVQTQSRFAGVVGYLVKVKELNKRFNVEAEIVLG